MQQKELEQAMAFYQAPPLSWYHGISDRLSVTGEWLWETLQGDFNENQTTGQIVTGTVISMIPLVDQLCDVRDLIANCKMIREDDSNTWSWICLGLTLVGCFPVLGSLAKGSMKVMFLSLRKAHYGSLGKAGNYSRLLDGTVGQLNRYLEMPTVRKTLRALKIYNPYAYLAGKLDELKGLLNVSALLDVMDKLMQVTRKLFDKVVSWGPDSLRYPVMALWDTLVAVRSKANTMLVKALQPLSDMLERLANRLRVESDNSFRAHVGDNTHLYGAERANKEIEFFKQDKPDWVDFKAKRRKFAALEDFAEQKYISDGWPDIAFISGRKTPTNGAFNTFDSSLKATELAPGTKIYRVVDPASGDNSICWMHEAEFKKLSSKSDWRRNFAVWKSWNENGEYVTYVIPPSQPLKVWEGRAATQTNRVIPDYSLEGGWNQIVVDPAQLKKEYTSPRQKTGWGYGDVESDPVYPYLGLPKLENTHNWYEKKDK